MSIETYQNLITSEHRKKSKLIAVLSALVSVPVKVQETLSTIPSMFDIDSASGDQLDILGKWVGLSRFIKKPITGVYFEWENSAIGWGSGIWQGQFSPTSGVTSLPDDVYRLIMKAKIAANRWNGSIPNAYDIWETVFTNNVIVIQDKQNMTMIIGVVGQQLDALTQALLTGGYIPLKPEGVGILYYAIPVNDGPIFVWNGASDTPETAGWGNGSWAKLLAPT